MKPTRRKFHFWKWLGVLLLALAFFWLARADVLSLYQVIDSVPAVFSGQSVTLQGKGFGSEGVLTLTKAGSFTPQVVQTDSWSTSQITATIPDLTSGDTFMVETRILGIPLDSNTFPVVVKLPELKEQASAFQVPVQPDAYWPLFRYDQRNTGSSPQAALFTKGETPWMFQTGKGVFSTPIIDKNGDIYVGSADHSFYSLSPSGKENWQFTSGEIIDSAAVLPADYLENGKDTVIFPGGDGFLYCLNLDSTAASGQARLLWKFDARVSPRASYNNWFEGNIAMGYDGTLYAGNTNFNYYAISPDGKLDWTYPTASNDWSIAAIAPDGTIYWGSNDTYIRAVDSSGKEKWTVRTLGFIAASAAIGSDGTVYIGSFDSYLYALDPYDGHVKWKFKTNDHIYASVALGADAQGNTNAIYFGSADGIFYAVNPQGQLIWEYDTGDPIRSSAALGASPDGKRDAIVYFGAGNGKLYALNTADGSRRWSFDTTSSDPILADRNDLNSSPALGPHGIVIASESGQVWQIPYDYCLNVQDSRCSTQATTDLPGTMSGMQYVTPGGSVELTDPATLPISTLITLKLIVRDQGMTQDAHLCNTPLLCSKNSFTVTATPSFDFTTEVSADGAYLYIRPTGFLEPNTKYTIQVNGDIYIGGLSIGNLTIGGSKDGTFAKTFSFQTEPAKGAFPLGVNGSAVTALEWTRLAVPLPSMMPSLNQIGFDYMDWIMAPVWVSQPDANGTGTFIVWVIGGKKDANGTLVPDPKSDFTLAFNGKYDGSSYILENQNVTIPVTGIPIPFNFLEMRGQLTPQLDAAPGTTLYADTQVMKIPTFGPYLVIAGLANNIYQKLVVSGTYIIEPYQSTVAANERPSGVTVSQVAFQPPTSKADGSVTATIQIGPGVTYSPDDHRPGILLVDSNKSQAIYLDYLNDLSSTTDANGSLQTITLKLPAGTELPQDLDAYVMLDVFPVYQAHLQTP